MVAAAALIWAGIAAAQDLTLRAYVDRTRVAVNEDFSLTVELSGSAAQRAPQPERPSLEAFAVFMGTSTSMSTQIINNRISFSRAFTHRFIATREGRYQIPAVTLHYQGKVYRSDPITIEVVKAGTSAPGGRRQPAPGAGSDLSDLLFMKATVSKRRVYQNEPVIISYKIYTAVNITDYSISRLPNTVGFWTEDLKLSQPQVTTEVVDGRAYRVAEIRRVAVFPQEPGKKMLDPLVVDCAVRLPRRRRSRDPFESFFDDPFFSVGQTVNRAVASNAVDIEVVPLPAETRPADFSGAVGQFTLRAEVDKDRVQTNEAVTLKVTISGVGNVKTLPAPSVQFPSDFEVYKPKITENIQRQGKISGSKTFEYVLIPRFPGDQTIGPLAFSYFDLGENRYKTLSTAPIVVRVSQGRAPVAAVPLAASKEDVELIGQDIRFIQTRLPEFERIGTAFHKSWAFWTVLFGPLLALVSAFAYRRHLDRLSSDVAYARSRKANRMALKRLRHAHKVLLTGDAKRFYSEVARALMGFIGDKLNVEPAGLITDEVDALLRARGIKEETIGRYLECLRTCDFKRFAPAESDNGEMSAFFELARKAIIELDREI